jgi:aspartate kinase
MYKYEHFCGIFEISSGEIHFCTIKMKGITDRLEEIYRCRRRGDIEELEFQWKELEHRFISWIEQLFREDDHKEARLRFETRLGQFRESLTAESNRSEILCFGEMTTVDLLSIYLTKSALNVQVLDPFHWLRKDRKGRVNLDRIGTLFPELERSDWCLLPGFLCQDAQGEVSNLGRGGSDLSATLFGAAIGAEEIVIWTDVDGVLDGDPRIAAGFTLEHISYDEAAELATFGAKVLHPISIRPARIKGIPVRVKNSMAPLRTGTLIDMQGSAGNRAIAVKKGITAIRIRSVEMLEAYGTLEPIFAIFRRHATPIDLITTSEVNIHLTIEDQSRLAPIVQELEDIGQVEVQAGLSIVSMIGDDILNNTELWSQALAQAAVHQPIMVSAGGSRNNVSVVVEATESQPLFCRWLELVRERSLIPS